MSDIIQVNPLVFGVEEEARKTDIATVESGSTASREYSVGELVYVNGNLYKVIASISLGSAFTVGTNIQSTTVSGAMGTGGSLTTNAQALPAQSIGANSVYQWGVAPTAISGYKAIGIVGFFTSINNVNHSVYLSRISGDNIQFAIRNEGGSAATFTPVVTVLYKKEQ